MAEMSQNYADVKDDAELKYNLVPKLCASYVNNKKLSKKTVDYCKLC